MLEPFLCPASKELSSRVHGNPPETLWADPKIDQKRYLVFKALPEHTLLASRRLGEIKTPKRWPKSPPKGRGSFAQKSVETDILGPWALLGSRWGPRQPK